MVHVSRGIHLGVAYTAGHSRRNLELFTNHAVELGAQRPRIERRRYRPSCVPPNGCFPATDKLADAVADTLVQAAAAREAKALCAIKVAVHRDAVYLTGRLACEGSDQLDG